MSPSLEANRLANGYRNTNANMTRSEHETGNSGKGQPKDKRKLESSASAWQHSLRAAVGQLVGTRIPRDFFRRMLLRQSSASKESLSPLVLSGQEGGPGKRSHSTSSARLSETLPRSVDRDYGSMAMMNMVHKSPVSAGKPADGASRISEALLKASATIAQLNLEDELDQSLPISTTFPIPDGPAAQAERSRHLGFIAEALEMARLALRTNETPVGCVLVHRGNVIARGMNATNVTRNGTRHAELMAISALLSRPAATGPRSTCLRPQSAPRPFGDCASVISATEPQTPDNGNEDGSMSHLYPYGQKVTKQKVVDIEVLQACELYVTVEPCVMCASLLRQLGIRKVYFGAVNDKFGGTGGVFSVHAGDGGNAEPGYDIEGGWGRDEAVGLLRRFYVQENGRAPIPRKKEGRAARLAALMDKDGVATSRPATPDNGAEVDLALLSGAIVGEERIAELDYFDPTERPGNLDIPFRASTENLIKKQDVLI